MSTDCIAAFSLPDITVEFHIVSMFEIVDLQSIFLTRQIVHVFMIYLHAKFRLVDSVIKPETTASGDNRV